MYTGWGRSASVFILGIGLLTATGPALAADPDGLCSKIRPLVNGGYSTVLLLYGEGGIRCSSSPWGLQLGWRYTQLENTTEPFVALSYDTALSPEWHLFVTGSLREHLGDYEVNRLPEATLRWTPPLPNSFIIPTVDFSAGWITTILPLEGQTVRTGVVLTLSTQPLRVAGATLSATYQTAEYFYGTGQNSSFWLGVLSANIPLRPSTAIGLTYIQQGGFGASPLVYDFSGYDQFVLGQVTETINPGAAFTLGAQFNINTPAYPGSVRQYTLAFSKMPEGWSIGIGWYAPRSQPFLFGTFPP